MWASLVAALVSAFCYGIASVMQAVAIRWRAVGQRGSGKATLPRHASILA